jgi:hypothetical protein
MKAFSDEIGSAAYELASKAYGSGHAEAKERLASQFPNLAWDDFVEVYLAACCLHETSYSLASEVREKKHSEAEAVLLLKKICPGFDETVYKRAFDNGMFASMW